jgi:type I restriction enzyme R subunit
VRGVNEQRVLTDVVALVRHAMQMEDELVPFPDQVQARYADWLQAQQAAGRRFSAEQRWWLDQIADHIGVNLAARPEDLDTGEFLQKGGRLGAMRVLGKDLASLLEEMNAALVR